MRLPLLLAAACAGGGDAADDGGDDDDLAGPGCDGEPTTPPDDADPTGSCPGGGVEADLVAGVVPIEATGEPCALCPGPDVIVRTTVVNPCAVEVDYPDGCVVLGGRITGPDGRTEDFPAPECRVEANALPAGGRAHEDVVLPALGSGPHTVEVDLATGPGAVVRFCVP